MKKFPSLQRLKDHPSDTAKNYHIDGFKGTVSFITSMTEHFCAGCNRLRLFQGLPFWSLRGTYLMTEFFFLMDAFLLVRWDNFMMKNFSHLPFYYYIINAWWIKKCVSITLDFGMRMLKVTQLIIALYVVETQETINWKNIYAVYW